MAKQTGSIDLKAAKNAHDEASKVANNFLAVDKSGIMVYDGTAGTQTPSAPDADTNNVFIDENSLDIRKGTDVLAMFGADGAQIGKSTKAHTVISEDGMHIYSVDSNDNLVELANIGYGEGNAQSGTAVAPYYTFGTRASGSVVGNYSVVEGYDATASSHASHAEGELSTASGGSSHAEGFDTTASGGGSHAEGLKTNANGEYSHAEGLDTTASGSGSHAEGGHATASGYFSHAEGMYTTASGYFSHAEGGGTTASGLRSHAQNDNTIASKPGQTAIGKYNIEDTATAEADQKAFIIGNGTSSARSNALTVDWQGNVVASGEVTDGHGNTLSNVSVDGSSVPTADTLAEFDSTAHMNSTDMTATEVSDFVDGLDVHGGIETEVIQLTASSFNHVSSVPTATLYKKGNVGVLYMNVYNTSANLAVGSSASFSISGLPTMIFAAFNGVGYSGSTALVFSVSASTVSMRAIGSAWVANYNCAVSIPLIFE